MQLNPLYEVTEGLGVLGGSLDFGMSLFDRDLSADLDRLVHRRPELAPVRTLIAAHAKPGTKRYPGLSVFGLRDACSKCLAWGIPTPAAVAALGRLGTIVEIGAGTGYWAALAAGAGATVHAFDNGSWELPLGTWHPVQLGGPEMAGSVEADALLLCWPPHSEPMAAEALRSFRGDTLVYVGEGDGGCTGDAVFHGMLEAEREEHGGLPSVSWPGIHDRIDIYRRKGGKRPAAQLLSGDGVVALARFGDIGEEEEI